MPGRGRPFVKGQAKPPGSGIQKGHKQEHTIARERSLREVQQLIYGQALEATQAILDETRGTAYLLIRRRDGTYVRATDEKQIDAAIAAGGERVKFYRKAPNAQAYQAVMNRAYGTPPESVAVTGHEGEPIEIRVKTKW